MDIYRTKFKRGIIAEFVVPKRQTNKVVIICGGMPSYPAKQKYTEIFEFFSKRGFWVFVPRYRGSWESEGVMFAKSPHLDILDIMDELPKGFANIWDDEKFKIKDPEVFLIGSSFGGPAALLNSKDNRVKKVIVFSPVLDWRTQDKTIESIPKISWFIKEAFGGGYRIAKNGWKKIEKGDFYNPATDLKNIDGPKCLIIQAKDDDVVFPAATLLFAKSISSKLLAVKTGGHMGVSIMEKRFKQKCFRHTHMAV